MTSEERQGGDRSSSSLGCGLRALPCSRAAGQGLASRSVLVAAMREAMDDFSVYGACGFLSRVSRFAAPHAGGRQLFFFESGLVL